MREVSIISIIRKYGLNSKRLSNKNRIKFKKALEDLSVYDNESLKLINVIDNYQNPEESISDKCMVPGCGKKIRYEHHLLEVESGDLISCGSNCCCTLLGLSKLKAKQFMTIEQALKEKAELEQWKKDNPYTVEKLETLSEYDLPYYRPFIEEIEFSALNQEDTAFINSLNTKLIVGDLKYLDAINDLIEYNPDAKKIYGSIRDHVLTRGKYLSKKQKEFVSSEYEKMLKGKTETTFVISNGYDYRQQLKELEFKFNGKDKTWEKTIRIHQADNLRNQLSSIGIDADKITIKNH